MPKESNFSVPPKLEDLAVPIWMILDNKKTRIPCGIAGLYIKPDETGRTFGGDAGT
jgi:hypothetical protein